MSILGIPNNPRSQRDEYIDKLEKGDSKRDFRLYRLYCDDPYIDEYINYRMREFMKKAKRDCFMKGVAVTSVLFPIAGILTKVILL